MSIEITVHYGGGNARHFPPPPSIANDLEALRAWALKEASVQHHNAEMVELLSDDHKTVRELWRLTELGWTQDA